MICQDFRVYFNTQMSSSKISQISLEKPIYDSYDWLCQKIGLSTKHDKTLNPFKSTSQPIEACLYVLVNVVVVGLVQGSSPVLSLGLFLWNRHKFLRILLAIFFQLWELP